MNKKLIILDRDGVINHDSDEYIKSPEEWVPIPGSIEAIGELSRAGFDVVVATNQSGLGRGYFDEYTLARMHEKMLALVEAEGGRITGVFFCPHLPEDDCACRKPRTGLLDRMEEELGVSVEDAWYLGDSLKDLECALARKCRPGLVLSGKGCHTYLHLNREMLDKVQVFDDLLDASKFILAVTPVGEFGLV